VAAAISLIEKYLGTNAIYSVIQHEFQGDQTLDLIDYTGLVRFANRDHWAYTDYQHHPVDTSERGRGLIFVPTGQTNLHELYLVGGGYRLLLHKKVSDRQEFSRANDQFDGPLTHYLRVEEGHFSANGDWIVDRLRNGDEITSGLWLSPDVGVVHAVLAD
jgi:hypothetical protein